MKYQEFINELVAKVQDKLGEDYKVKITDVEKNNGVILEGMVIISKGDSISPNIYFEQLYHKFREGESFDEIFEEVIAIYKDAVKNNKVEVEKIIDFEIQRENIFFRLVNYNLNKNYLEQVPHIRYLDFAITFHCLINKQEQGIHSYCINENIIKKWKITTEELYQIALKNTPLLFPPKINSMETVMHQLLGEGKSGSTTTSEELFLSGTKNYAKRYDVVLEEMKEKLEEIKEDGIYILSNSMGINGATVILYSGLIEAIAEKIGHNLYLLPSSVHEWIIVDNQENQDEHVLSEMVNEVNQTHVADDEVLSDKVYFYDYTTKKLA